MTYNNRLTDITDKFGQNLERLTREQKLHLIEWISCQMNTSLRIRRIRDQVVDWADAMIHPCFLTTQ